MPKLSQKTLAKMFQCTHCGEYFRTRQGLSGHIRFKHKPTDSRKGSNTVEELVDITYFETFAHEAGLSGPELADLKQMLSFWQSFTGLLCRREIKLNHNDYKNYLLTSLALVRANQLQSQTIIINMGNAIGAGVVNLINGILADKLESQALMKQLAQEMTSRLVALDEKITSLGNQTK